MATVHTRPHPKTVQALSRHAEFTETMDTYAHPPVAVPGVTVRTFGDLFSAAGEGTGHEGGGKGEGENFSAAG